MATMRFIPLGIGDAFSARFYSSSLLVEFNGQWLLVDCPHPIRKILREASTSAHVQVDIGDICGVALTHLHSDHVSGLEGYAYFTHYALNQKTQLFAHADVVEKLWSGHLSAAMEYSDSNDGKPPAQRNFDDFFRWHELCEDQKSNAKSFAIECRKTVHSIPTTAFKIHAGDQCLGYSADTAYDDSLIEWLAEADVIIHECGHGGLHSDYDKLAKLPTKLRKKMYLIHCSDEFDRKNSKIAVLEQGRMYTV